MDKAASLCKRLSELKALRSPYEAHWGECYKYGAPERQQNFNDTSGTFYTAKNDRVKLVDSTASEAILNAMVPTMISGTVPANSIWFKAAPDGIDDPSVLTNGEAWLEPVCQFLWRNIHGSRTFDAEIVDFFTDWCVAGWAVNYTDLDRKNNGGYVFETWPIGECWLATTRKDNQVDTIFRVYEMTARQICTEYDENKVPLVVKEAAAHTPDKKYKILWAIEPRTKHKEYEGKPLLPKQMPFASYHVLMDGEKAILKESGYNEFPCQVARYRRIPSSVYGIGAMSTALPDTKQLQIMQRDFSRALQMAALGMYAGADDGILNTANVRIGPGLFIPVNSTDSIKRIDDARGVPMLENAIEKLQGTIRRKLLADMMTPQYGQPMTAAETYARVDQTRQQIGPLYGRIQSELLIPLLERCFGIAYRAGAIGQAPEDLQGRNLSFKFISPLARAQKLEEIASIERLMGSLGAFAELAPEALDNIDFDAIPQVLAAGLGVPTSVMRTEDKLVEYREQKAQAQQQAQAQEQEAMMMQQMAGAAAQGMGKGLEAQIASEVMQ